MQTFTIYPKGKGKAFPLTCERFELKADRFILYNSVDKESQIGYLALYKVAAIVPDRQDEARGYPNSPFRFFVYLKDRDEPIHIFANAFKTENQLHVIFLNQDKDMGGNVEQEWPLTNIYVATSELIAILPSDGLIQIA